MPRGFRPARSQYGQANRQHFTAATPSSHQSRSLGALAIHASIANWNERTRAACS
jgi:hypothetical protein